jgi:hypothetical protein
MKSMSYFPTPRQQRVLGYIEQEIKKEGRARSLREVADGLWISYSGREGIQKSEYRIQRRRRSQMRPV